MAFSRHYSTSTPRTRYTSSSSYNRNPKVSNFVDPYWLLLEKEEYDRATRGGYLQDYDDRTVLGQLPPRDSFPRDVVYVEKLDRLMSAPPCIGVPPQPSLVWPGLYMGTQANAENLDCLKRNKITHVLNCAGVPGSLKRSRSQKYEGTGIVYEEIPADDDEDYPIRKDFYQAHSFIDRGRVNGRCLIHCTGVSRSGAIGISYIVRSGCRLLEAAQRVKKERRCVLCNSGFMAQVVQHARECGMLDPDPDDIYAPKYGGAISKSRINCAHLPTFL